MGKTDTRSAARNNSPFRKRSIPRRKAINFRKCIDEHIASNPELFPPEIKEGYQIYYQRSKFNILGVLKFPEYKYFAGVPNFSASTAGLRRAGADTR